MIEILTGDCREILKTLPSESVHCCVTSPPYFGLRDYGVAGQIGLEATPDAYVAELVAIFREAKRVLRNDGTLWLNLGDSYAGGGGHSPNAPSSKTSKSGLYGDALKSGGLRPGNPAKNGGVSNRDGLQFVPGVKPKDLVGIPWLVAFALRADGWYLRQDIIWSKPNPMPESVTDRCTKAHEYIFLLSKSERYFYDNEAIKEPAEYSGLANQDESGFKDPRSFNGKHKEGYNSSGEPKSFKGSKFNQGKTANHQLNRSSDKPRRASGDIYTAQAFDSPQSAPRGPGSDFGEFEKRNKRSVWTVSTQAYSEAHFATFPPALIEPCILAGCPKGGTVLDCFGGAGTTGLVADRLQRKAILIELNPAYATMARNRIHDDAPLLQGV
jgi:DNA modification methylase